MGHHKSKNNKNINSKGSEKQSTSMGLKFGNLKPGNASNQAEIDADDLAYQFEGKMRLQPFEEKLINFAQYDFRVKLGNNGVNPVPGAGYRFWEFSTRFSFKKMRPRDGMQYIDPADVDYVFSGRRTQAHLCSAFKLSAVVDNEEYTFAYIDKKMAEIINQMTKHISMYDPKRPIHWIKYTIDKVPVLSCPNLDPYITFELTVRLVKARQTWLLNNQPGQAACQTALAVDNFLVEMGRPRGFFQTVFPDYGGLLDGLDAEKKVLGTVGEDGVLVTLDEAPAPADYTWASDGEGDNGRESDAGRDKETGDAGDSDDEDMGDGMEVEMENDDGMYDKGEYGEYGDEDFEEDPNDIDGVKNVW